MITILTEPSSKWYFIIFKFVKNLVKKYIFKKEILKYSGHYAVVRSLLEGFDEIGHPYNYNPKLTADFASHVHVLASINALKLAIKLKKRGKIKRLTAGPNIVVSSSDFNGIIADVNIDFYLVNSEWTKQAYLIDNPKLINRINYFASGVDTFIWDIRRKKIDKLRLLFYNKKVKPQLIDECAAISKKYNAIVDFIYYGSYNTNQFKEKLSKSDFVVYFSPNESQGIAIFETWASDTPTIHWDTGYWNYNLKNYKSSSAPYLSNQTGQKFIDTIEFEALFTNNLMRSELYSPRKWILENEIGRAHV